MPTASEHGNVDETWGQKYGRELKERAAAKAESEAKEAEIKAKEKRQAATRMRENLSPSKDEGTSPWLIGALLVGGGLLVYFLTKKGRR